MGIKLGGMLALGGMGFIYMTPDQRSDIGKNLSGVLTILRSGQVHLPDLFTMLGLLLVGALLYEAYRGCCTSPECLRRRARRSQMLWHRGY